MVELYYPTRRYGGGTRGWCMMWYIWPVVHCISIRLPSYMLNYDILQLHWVPAALTFFPNSTRNTHDCSRPFIATNATPLPLNPWTEENLKYPWEDGSFSRRWVHVRGEEDECERLDLNSQVPPLDKCDLGNDWPADYQLGRQLLCFWLPWVLRWASFQTLFHIFMVLCTLACCKRCQCTEPREVSGVIAWLHLLQCFLSTSLLGDTRWGQSAMVSCQKRALVLSCTWLERDMMLGKRKSAGSHISSNIPACSFLCRKPTRLPDIGQCFFSLQSKNKKTLPSEFLITVLVMTAVVGNTHVFSTAREQLTKTKRLHGRARPFSEIAARSPTVEALASRYL